MCFAWPQPVKGHHQLIQLSNRNLCDCGNFLEPDTGLGGHEFCPGNHWMGFRRQSQGADGGLHGCF